MSSLLSVGLMVRVSHARGDGTAHWNEWCGCKELLAAAELWNLRIVVVRPGHATVLVGRGEKLCGSSWSQDTMSFWRLTTLNTS